MRNTYGSGNRDFFKYNHMPTEVLENIIRADFYLSEEAADPELIDYILEILEGRKTSEAERNLPDIEESWERFKKDRLVMELEDAPAPTKDDIIDFANISPKKHLNVIRRIASIAAVFICVLFIGTVTAYAVGIDLWGSIARWTEERFSFLSDGPVQTANYEDIPPQLIELSEMLQEQDVAVGILPHYLPDGYERDGNSFFDNSDTLGVISMDVGLTNGSNYIVISYDIHTDGRYLAEYEKDDVDLEIYECKNIPYYIFTNTGDSIIVWVNGNVECSISGLPNEEIYKVIESIG